MTFFVVCVCVRVCVCVCACTYIWWYVYIWYIYVYTYGIYFEGRYVDDHCVYVHIYDDIYICDICDICIYVCVCVCVCLSTHTHTHTHTHIGYLLRGQICWRPLVRGQKIPATRLLVWCSHVLSRFISRVGNSRWMWRSGRGRRGNFSGFAQVCQCQWVSFAPE